VVVAALSDCSLVVLFGAVDVPGVDVEELLDVVAVGATELMVEVVVGCCVFEDESTAGVSLVLLVVSVGAGVVGTELELVVGTLVGVVGVVTTVFVVEGSLFAASANTWTGCRPINNSTAAPESIFTFSRPSIVTNRLFCISTVLPLDMMENEPAQSGAGGGLTCNT
jgi:hypothetical protein